MSFINQVLLGGLALAVVPVILHLLLRPRPRTLVFPALALVQQRRRASVKRLRLRHLLLLALRMAAIAVCVLALARPRVPAGNYAPTAGETALTIALLGLAAGAYWTLARRLRSRPAPPELLARRRMRLGGAVAAACVMFWLLLVGWPFQRRVAAEFRQPISASTAGVPVAAVLLFDTSLSMQYRFESKTRLDVARAIAQQHVKTLPSGSRIAVADTARNTPIEFQGDLSRSVERIEDLAAEAISFPLNDRLLAALDAHREELAAVEARTPAGQTAVDLLREIYVFTDLAKSAWQLGRSPVLEERLTQLAGVNLYLVDVGVTQPVNAALDGLTLSTETLAAGTELTLQGSLRAGGRANLQRTVELYVENEAGKLVKQGQTAVDLVPGVPGQVQFAVRGVTGPVAQGELRLSTSDPLTFDDVRYFTLEVRPPREVLVVSDNRQASLWWMNALVPQDALRLGIARFRCTRGTKAQLDARTLSAYHAVCLVDVADPGAGGWTALEEYVSAGGGLVVIVGPRANRVAYNSAEAQSILPGELLAQSFFDPPATMDVTAATHPLLKKFSDWGASSELATVPFRRAYNVEPASGSTVILRFAERRAVPAVLERLHGRGRTVLVTTLVEGQRWNNLTVSWSFLPFADQVLDYVSQQSREEFNFLAGEDVSLSLSAEGGQRHFLLRKPGGREQTPVDVPAKSATVALRDVRLAGQYRLLGAEPESKFDRGFSVNPLPAESDLTRLVEPELNTLLGEKRYSLARDIDGLTRNVGRVRLGREIVPLMALALLAVFCLELVVASRFYETASEADPGASPRAASRSQAQVPVGAP